MANDVVNSAGLRPASKFGVVLCALAVLMIAAALSGQAAAVFAAESTDQKIAVLNQFGVQASAESIAGYLAKLDPDAGDVEHVSQLIQQLGDEEFRGREAAMHELMGLPFASKTLLQQATASGDYEVAYRAGLILRHGDKHRARLLQAILMVVEENQIKGLAQAVLDVIPHCEEQYMLHAARRTLKATCLSRDQRLLKQAVASPRAEIQVAAIEAIGSVAYEENRELLDELLHDARSHRQLAAAWVLAGHGERSSLPVLASLLTSADDATRGQSVRLLRALTGEHFGYAPFDSEQRRTAAAKKWQTWIAQNGKTVQLQLPIRFRGQEVGRTLICVATKQKVIEIDADGQQIWEQDGLQYPWRAEGLPNGHRLVASYGGKFAVEFDSSGKEVWRKERLPGGPHSIQRLDNGNTLMACSDSHKVLEVSPGLKIAWEIHIDGRPTDARRLANGRTLIVLKNAGEVVEVNPAGEILWRIAGLNWPNTAQRLENGNTLVSEVRANRIVEFDGGGNVVWEKKGIKQPYDAQILSNGHILVSQNSLVSIIDRGGNTVWAKKTEGDTRVSRY